MEDLVVQRPDGAGQVKARRYPAAGDAAGATLILAHGAGAPQTHPWMVGAATGLARRGVSVVTFNFAYMEAGRRVPDRAPVLEACWRDVIRAIREGDAPGALFIGGKSMGGRMASHVAARHAAEAGELAGLVLLGYPLHPPGNPGRRRDAHLASIALPTLVVQGTRDGFGTPAEVASAFGPLGSRLTLHAVEQGDHSFAVPRAFGTNTRDVLDRVWDLVAAWIGQHC